jgi:hypothetical protein
MKQGAYFIVVSRCKTYDGNALVKALDEKHLPGAGLDVTDPEPLPKGHPLWKFESVVITPHLAVTSDGLRGRQMYVFKENVRRFSENKPLIHYLHAECTSDCPQTFASDSAAGPLQTLKLFQLGIGLHRVAALTIDARQPKVRLPGQRAILIDPKNR